MTNHEGIPTKVENRNGTPCSGAAKSDYPLSATCSTCGSRITCADGSADWAHVADSGPSGVCWEYQANELPIRLSYSIKVF